MGRREPLVRRAVHNAGLVALATVMVIGTAMANATAPGAPHATATGAVSLPYDTRTDALSDGSAPLTAAPAVDPLDDGRPGPLDRVVPAQGAGQSTPSAATGSGQGTVPVGGRVGLTPGHGTQPSQRTGNGWSLRSRHIRGNHSLDSYTSLVCGRRRLNSSPARRVQGSRHW